MKDSSFKNKVLKELESQNENLDEIAIIKLILNTVQWQSVFLNLVHVNWKNDKRVYSLKEDAKNLIKEFKNVN